MKSWLLNCLALFTLAAVCAMASDGAMACPVYSQECFSARIITAEGRDFSWRAMPVSFGRIDLNHDGIRDHVFVGRPNKGDQIDKKIRIGVVLGWKEDRSRSSIGSEPVRTSSFDLFLRRNDVQGGLCDSRPSFKVLSVAPDAMEFLGSEPDGYPRHAENAVFEIGSGECDPIYAYWNGNVDRLEWLRP